VTHETNKDGELRRQSTDIGPVQSGQKHQRWAIYIDSEGFGVTFPGNQGLAIRRLGGIMEGIYRLGTGPFAKESNRLFVHQIGDGFIIVSNGGMVRPEVPIAVALILMRCAAQADGLAKAGVAYGDFGDFKNCYPDIVRDHYDGGTVQLGHGLMRIFPVMGTALIKAYRQTRRASGSLLLVDGSMVRELPSTIHITKDFGDCVSVDWIHSELPEVLAIASQGSIKLTDGIVLERFVRDYISINADALHPDWAANTVLLNGCGTGSTPLGI